MVQKCKQNNYVKLEDIHSFVKESKLSWEIAYFYVALGSKIALTKQDGNQLKVKNSEIKEEFGLTRYKKDRFIKELEKKGFLTIEREVGGENIYTFNVAIFKGYRDDKEYPKDPPKSEGPKIEFNGQTLAYPQSAEEDQTQDTQSAPGITVSIPPVEITQGNQHTPCRISSSENSRDHARTYNKPNLTLKTPPTEKKGVGSFSKKIIKKNDHLKTKLSKRYVELKMTVEGQKPKKSKGAWIQFIYHNNEQADTWEYLEEEIREMENKAKAQGEKTAREATLKKQVGLKQKIRDLASKKLDAFDEFDEEYTRLRSVAVQAVSKNNFICEFERRGKNGEDKSRGIFEKAIRAEIHSLIYAQLEKKMIPVEAEREPVLC
jgi:hypothetical protein